MMRLIAVSLVFNSPVLDWSVQHLHWPVIVLAAWKVSRWVSRLQTQAVQAAKQIDLLATNHFPHMEASLARQDVYLESIDKNIGRMAEKL